MMTYSEAMAIGYRPVETRLQQGYVSRRSFELDNAEVHRAGGYRNGDLYILEPNFKSTRYCYRVYLQRG